MNMVTPRRIAWTPDLIIRLREHAGWTRKQLAYEAGVAYPTLTKWEAGTHLNGMACRLLDYVAQSVGFSG